MPLADMTAPTVLVADNTPLSAFAANATFLFENKALAPKTAALYAAFTEFFSTNELWRAFTADTQRHQLVREMWNSTAMAIPLSNAIVTSHHIHTVGPFRPFLPSAPSEWSILIEKSCPLALVCCIGELQDELQARPDILSQPLPVDVAISIDRNTRAALTLRELFAMVLGATIVRSDADPRLTGVILDARDASIETLILLASALEGEQPLLTPNNIKISLIGLPKLILPIGAVMMAGQRAYAAYNARAQLVKGLTLY